MSEKDNRFKNVVDYGADPTGVEDSTSAIQKAVDESFKKERNMSEKQFSREDVHRAISDQHVMLYLEGNLLDTISDLSEKDLSKPLDIAELLRNVAENLEYIASHLIEIQLAILKNFHVNTWTPFNVSDHPDDVSPSSDKEGIVVLKSISEIVKDHTEDCSCKACDNKRSWDKVKDAHYDDYDPFLGEEDLL